MSGAARRSRTSRSTRAAPCCSHRATSSCPRASSPTGYWRTAFPCASRSSCTNTSGATRPASDSMPDPRAVVLVSGGLDSATALAIARAEGFECYALSVSYGQRHAIELNAAARVAEALGAREHRLMSVDLATIGGSARTDSTLAVPDSPTSGIPITYVPARNTIMLSLALAWAEVLEAQDIFFGVNAVDYSGYPDCRPEYVDAFERMANLATKAAIEGKP